MRDGRSDNGTSNKERYPPPSLLQVLRIEVAFSTTLFININKCEGGLDEVVDEENENAKRQEKAAERRGSVKITCTLHSPIDPKPQRHRQRQQQRQRLKPSQTTTVRQRTIDGYLFTPTNRRLEESSNTESMTTAIKPQRRV
ncbi:unnamed protein product [Soboliphyme baturini]|uniref:Uncharacterized protein n=1 Tax=Soboliphyme baturini TaxID=241478 RepID=A0A183IFK3_9BILA|nr:unnamed protein product [Soboliphyme baturini]